MACDEQPVVLVWWDPSRLLLGGRHFPGQWHTAPSRLTKRRVIAIPLGHQSREKDCSAKSPFRRVLLYIITNFLPCSGIQISMTSLPRPGLEYVLYSVQLAILRTAATPIWQTMTTMPLHRPPHSRWIGGPSRCRSDSEPGMERRFGGSGVLGFRKQFLGGSGGYSRAFSMVSKREALDLTLTLTDPR